MALTCGLLGADATTDCLNLPVAGLDDFIYLYNKSEIASITEASGVISAIAKVATTGVRSYKWQGPTGFLTGTYAQANVGQIPKYTHSLSFLAPNDSQLTLEEVEKLAKGRVVAVVAKFSSTVTATFRVYGKTVGLTATEIAGDEGSEENDGLPLITLASPTTPKAFYESKLPQHLLDTDYTTTLAALEADLTPNV